MLISIHEIIHGILAYERLNKTFKIDDTSEILPILYEKIYMNEQQSKKLEAYQNKLNYGLDPQNKKHKKYLIALAVREELLKKYNYDIKKTQKLSRKLIRKLKLS